MKQKYNRNSLGKLLPGTALLAAIGASTVAAPGQTFLANSSDYKAASNITNLDEFVVSCPADDQEQVLNELFPSVPAGGRLFRFAKAADDDYLTETRDDDIRDTYAAPKIVKSHGTTATDEIRNKILGRIIDLDAWPKDQRGKRKVSETAKWVKKLRKRLVRADLFRGLSLLNAAATNTAVTWNASANPDGDLRQKIEAATCRPNIIVFSSTAWSMRKDSYEASSRTNDSLSKHAEYTEAQLADYLKVSKVIVLRAKYMAIEGGNILDMLGDVVIGYYADESPSEDDASNIKRFTDVCDNGQEWMVYEENHLSKIVTLLVEHYSQFVVTRPSGIFKLTVSA